MKKNKTIALTLGLTMMTMSITPVFAQSTNASYVSSIVNKNSNNMVINLNEQTISNIAVDLGLSEYQVESVLTDSYKQTKPAKDNKKGEEVDHSVASTEPPALVECEGPYEEVTTLPADVDNTEYQEVMTLPAEVGNVPYTTLPFEYGNVPYTTLPYQYGDAEYTTLPAVVGETEAQQPQICVPNVNEATDAEYQEVTTLPAVVGETEAQQPQICVPNVNEATDAEYQEVTTLPAVVGETEAQQPQICVPNVNEETSFDKQTRPFVNPGKIINAIKKNDNINPVVVTEEKIATLAELSGKSEDFVKETLSYASVEAIVTAERQTPSTSPVTTK